MASSSSRTDNDKEQDYLLDSTNASEQDRLNAQHNILRDFMDGRIFKAPLPKDVKTVLDVATGTGVWATEFALLYPGAQVDGVDIVLRTSIDSDPKNTSFSHLDLTSETWSLPNAPYDYIHQRLLFLAPLDWDVVVGKIYDSLRPGGWYECLDAVWPPESENEGEHPEAVMSQALKLIKQGTAKLGVGRQYSYITRMEDTMRAAGLVDIRVEKRRMPIGGWHADRRLKQIGARMEADSANNTLPLANAIIGGGTGMSIEDCNKLNIDRHKESLEHPELLKCYMTFYNVIGRKPE